MRLEETEEKIKITEKEIEKELEKHNIEGIKYCVESEKSFIKYIRNLIFK